MRHKAFGLGQKHVPPALLHACICILHCAPLTASSSQAHSIAFQLPTHAPQSLFAQRNFHFTDTRAQRHNILWPVVSIIWCPKSMHVLHHLSGARFVCISEHHRRRRRHPIKTDACKDDDVQSKPPKRTHGTITLLQQTERERERRGHLHR